MKTKSALAKSDTTPKVPPKLEPSMALHTVMVGYHVYTQQLKQGIANNLEDSAFAYISNTILKIKPRDPLEEMLVMQSIWTQARLARLSIIANQQTSPNHLQVVNDACDRAANTFRRQMLALAEYRHPRRNDSFMAIKQANVAQQQIVQNVERQKSPTDEHSNEKGLPAKEAAAIPPVSRRPAIASPVHSTIKTVASDAGPADGGGQGHQPNECIKTR